MSHQPMDRSRTIVITGGIGFGAVTAILRSENGPWHVVLPVRDAGRGQVAVEKLTAGAAAGNTVGRRVDVPHHRPLAQSGSVDWQGTP
jgi:hypothetical protein